ncbi:MAG: transcriptional regulator, AbrB family domain protein [Mycobacterium sp.]|jgi:antitoxin PrlF|nr:transcriptional regulator, AbrB family domain protein [Mycobacterium sp.]
MTKVARLRAKGQVTLPDEVRDAIHVREGDSVEFTVNMDGTVVMRGMRMIPTDQAWFWMDSWQRGEREASEDIEAGRTEVFDSTEDFLKSLD